MDLQLQALRHSVTDTSTLRRAILCLVSIGAPLLIGTLLDQRRAGLICALAGLMLYFADADGPLRSRLSILTLCAIGLLAGGLAGHLLYGQSAFWAAFAVTAFAAGWSFRSGKAAVLAARAAAMAMAVTGTVAAIEPHEAYYAIGTVGLVALFRVADHFIFGPLPQLQPPMGTGPPGHGGWLRFAAAYGAAAVAGLWVGVTLDPVRAVAVAATSLFVMQPDAQNSYVLVVGRIVGAFTGVVTAYVIAQLFAAPALLCSAALLVALLIPHHLADRYWLHTALIAVFILLASDLAEFGLPATHALFAERLQDMLLGCGLALVATAAAFPHEGRPSSDRGNGPK